jgi:hypothetical protein
VYSISLLNAIALFAGKVHGVVVQIKAFAFSADTPLFCKAAGNDTNGIFTNAAVQVCWSSYSSSASARAVREEGDQ